MKRSNDKQWRQGQRENTVSYESSRSNVKIGRH